MLSSTFVDEFVYFGKAGTDDYKNANPQLKQAIAKLTQGHRINHTPTLASELSGLYQQLIKKHGSQKTLGRPHHALENCPPCHETEGDVVCVPGSCSAEKPAVRSAAVVKKKA